MTDNEFYTIVGYLANPIRNTLIEVEMHPNHRAKFAIKYNLLTNGYPLVTTAPPLYVWGASADKWGKELRVYFVSNANIPQVLTNILEPKRVNTRPGYDIVFDKRFNGNKFIERLFSSGFILGNPQQSQRIRSSIDPQYIVDFNNGYNL